MTTTNPYVATPKGVDWARGSTELSDVKHLWDDASNQDLLSGVFDTGGFALDVLGDIGDPLGAVIGCAVGWIVEHVSFLRDPVDWLAGDPDSIDAATTTWNNVSAGMRSAATSYATTLNGLTEATWSGDAADAYRKKGADWVGVLDGAATAAEVQGVLIAATGGLCAAFRGLIFEAISDAIERWVLVGLVALANSAWTFGASIAGWILDVEIEAGLLAARITAKIAELVEKAGRIAESMGRTGGKVEQIGQKLVALSARMMHDVHSSRGRLGWDTRYSSQDRTGHVVHDALHLHDSVHDADGLLHLGAVKAGLEDVKNAADAAAHPDDPATLDELARTGVKQATERATDRPKEALTDQLGPRA